MGDLNADNEHGLCPYLSVCEVGGVDVVALRVEPNTLTRFGGCQQGVAQHFYPSSLKFSLNIVTPEGYYQATHLGLQRKVLAELNKSQSLVQPSELYQFCLMSGIHCYAMAVFCTHNSEYQTHIIPSLMQVLRLVQSWNRVYCSKEELY